MDSGPDRHTSVPRRARRGRARRARGTSPSGRGRARRCGADTARVAVRRRRCRGRRRCRCRRRPPPARGDQRRAASRPAAAPPRNAVRPRRGTADSAPRTDRPKSSSDCIPDAAVRFVEIEQPSLSKSSIAVPKRVNRRLPCEGRPPRCRRERTSSRCDRTSRIRRRG